MAGLRLGGVRDRGREGGVLEGDEGDPEEGLLCKNEEGIGAADEREEGEGDAFLEGEEGGAWIVICIMTSRELGGSSEKTTCESMRSPRDIP